MDAELVVDAGEVTSDRLLAKQQRGGDLAVGLPRRDPVSHLARQAQENGSAVRFARATASRAAARAGSRSPAQYAARGTTSSAHVDSRSLPDTSAESAPASAADNSSLSCPVIKSAVDSTRRNVGAMKL